jgi:tetratricopeptide (TPR) repeat protein
MHLAVQQRSSPWENLARATETDPEALARLARALVSAQPDSPQELFLRRLWSGLAATLVEKRELVSIEAHLAPLAERFAPWIELERALAHADLELLEPEAAAGHLRVVVEEAPLDLGAHMMLGHALEMAGDTPGAVAEYRRALEIQPGRRDVRRRLAMALVRAGDPEGGDLVEELLAEDPEDEELERFRGVGPFPPLEVRFVPFSDEHLGRKPRDPEADEHGDHGH